VNKRTLSKRMLVVALALGVAATSVYALTLRAGTARAVLMPPPTISVPSCPQLPQNLNLTTASDEQLSAYGLPTYDDVMADLPDWQAWIASQPQQNCDLPVDSTYQAVPPPQETVVEPDLPTSDVAPGISVVGKQTTRWAGNEAWGSPGTYQKAEMTLQVATIRGNVGDGALAWTGLGGDNAITSGGAVLVQAGVLARVDYNVGGVVSQFNESWIEVYPQVHIKDLPLCRLANGDSLNIYVTSNRANDGYDYFRITNTSANCYHSCKVHTTNPNITDTCGFSGGSSYDSDGATGECIVERYGNAPVAQWNVPGHAWREQFCTMNGTRIVNLDHIYDTLVSCLTCSTRHRLVYPGPISSYGGFNQNWVAST
jgi:hypothetical protein